MTVTKVRVDVVSGKDRRLRAFASIVIDDELAIHDLRIIDGDRGLFIAFPDRPVTDACLACESLNPLASHYCGRCGNKLESIPAPLDSRGRPMYFMDCVHPISAALRQTITDKILSVYKVNAVTIPQTSG